MIILKLLHIDDFYGEGNNIEIAKGKYKLPETVKEGITQLTRELKWTNRIT